MTNYVMLELLLTRFHDRRLFARPGVLRFLVLDELHTYTGKRGADVAGLVRRLKQHTGTSGHLRCIGTSATVESAGDVSAAEAVADFAQRLFGEPFAPADVITESYAPLPEDLPPLTRAIADALAEGPLTIRDLASRLDVQPDDVQATLLSPSPSPLHSPSSPLHSPVPKLHAFFSQGRAIAACLQSEPHLNDRGERICPVCAEEGNERATFPLVFCRACGQEYWSVAVDPEGRLHPANLDDVEAQGRLGYLLDAQPEIALPDNWLTKTGKVRGGKSGYQDVEPKKHTLCPVCACLDSDCDHEDEKRPVTFLPAPFLLCPTCGIVHDRRPREYNKLFTFGSVGRSTATDVLVNAQVQSLPRKGNKVIAFSDNRQDTALQATHMNSLHRRFTFRQALYTALREAGCVFGDRPGAQLGEVGHLLFATQQRHEVQPRFRLDNQALVRAHVNALVLETMSLKGAEGLPSRPRELLDIDQPLFPLSADWRTVYQDGIQRHFDDIVAAVEEAFAREMQGDLTEEGFEWFDRAFVERQVGDFVQNLDGAMDRWRDEYDRLDAERRAINRQLGEQRVDYSLNRRRTVIENKLEKMREGTGDWYLYRYLDGEGFLPGYAFPPEATVLAFDDQEDEMARDPDIALTEYAPGNFVYYRGERYEVTHARPRRRRVPGTASRPDTELDVERVLVCPVCERAYGRSRLGEQETNRAACACGQDLSLIHPRQGMALTDMYAQQRAHITADEEERLRLGYEVTTHYRAGGKQRVYQVRAAGSENQAIFNLTLEQGGEVLRVNRGQRQQEGDPRGFTLCGKCHRWLIGENAPEDHVYTPGEKGQCPRNPHPEDLVRGLWLTKDIHSDLALFDLPLRQLAGGEVEPLPGDDIEAFYTTLSHTLERALMVAFNLDEREISSFLTRSPGSAPAPASDEAGAPYRVVLYETTVGGSGVLASLAEPGRLATVVQRARELLHEGDPEGGCQKACYACLLSFYNQRVHHLLDRTLVLPWLQSLDDLAVEPVVSEGRFDALAGQCQSGLERQVLEAIRDRGLPLADEAQRTVYDGDEPLVIADFFYEPKIIVFVDGSPHHRDYVQEADRRKRLRLKGLGYRLVVVKAEDPQAGLDDLASRLAP